MNVGRWPPRGLTRRRWGLALWPAQARAAEALDEGARPAVLAGVKECRGRRVGHRRSPNHANRHGADVDVTTTPGEEIEAVRARRSQLGAEVERRVSSIAANRTVNRDDPRARGTAA